MSEKAGGEAGTSVCSRGEDRATASADGAHPMLRVRDLWVSYGKLRVLHGVNLEVKRHGVVALLGANGAGKSTLLRAISGLARPDAGSIEFEDESIVGQRPSSLVHRGLVHVPERRPLFADLTVEENLMVGAYSTRGRSAIATALERAFEYFPILKERSRQRAATLSGGEQQMLVIARALMASPRLLLLDEPSLGLAPLVVRDIYRIITRINREQGVAVLMAEPNVGIALSIADLGYVIETGTVMSVGSAAELRGSEQVRRSYLGQGAAST